MSNHAKTNQSESASPTITEKIAQLDQSIEWFYGDDFSLEQALDKYQSAAALAQDIKQDLAELKNKVEVLEDFTKN